MKRTALLAALLIALAAPVASSTVIFLPVGDATLSADGGQTWQAASCDGTTLTYGGTDWMVDYSAGLYRDVSSPATLTIVEHQGGDMYLVAVE